MEELYSIEMFYASLINFPAKKLFTLSVREPHLCLCKQVCNLFVTQSIIPHKKQEEFTGFNKSCLRTIQLAYRGLLVTWPA